MAQGRTPISKEASAFWESFSKKQQQEIYYTMLEWHELKQSLISRNTSTALLDETIELEIQNMMNCRDVAFKSLRIGFEVFIKQQSEQKENKDFSANDLQK